MKRLNDSSDVPEARHKATFYFRAGMGTPGCISKRAGGKRVCCGFRSLSAYGLQKRPLLCRIEDNVDIEKSDDGDDVQRRGANQRRSHGICQRIGLIRDGYAS